MMLRLTLIASLVAAAAAQNVTVPGDACVWRGEGYGRENFCEGNEVSGKSKKASSNKEKMWQVV